MGPPTDIEGAVELRRWRRGTGLSRAQAAAELGISERMLAYYETGEYPTPRAVRLATRALAAGLGYDKPLTRERWVTLVQNMLEYGRGEPVVGHMLRAGDREHLDDFLGFVRRGPDADLALTDPSLFQSLVAAVTRAHLAGLARFRLRDDDRTTEVPRAAE